VPPHVAEPLKSARKIIAMSRYGQDELTDAGFERPLYVPHAVDPEIFHPRTEAERHAARQKIGVTDNQFLVTFVGVNDSVPSRKAIPEMLMAWKMFSDIHPDAVLYMHTMTRGNLPINNIGGVKIDAIVNTLNVRPDSLRMVDQHRYKAGVISQNEVADLMGAANVHLAAGRGEGFGVPCIESQRCGTPLITTNFAATSRLLIAGWHVDYEADWSWQDSFYAKPGVISMLEALEMAYAARDDERLRKTAEIGAMEFDLDNVMTKYMTPALDAIAEDVLERLAV
jgi:glycosyltransferase involved in cell wall biosynthesis